MMRMTLGIAKTNTLTLLSQFGFFHRTIRLIVSIIDGSQSKAIAVRKMVNGFYDIGELIAV